MKGEEMKTVAIILAGGLGVRFNAGIPKQLVKINGEPIIVYTLKTFEKCKSIDEIAVAIHKDWVNHFKTMLKRYNFKKVKYIIEGGATRQESSYNTLKFLKDNCIAYNDDIVVIHDATRPFVTEEIIKKNIDACKTYGSVDTVIKTVDTMIVADGEGFIKEIPKRDYLYNGQTPQTFRFGVIWKAHEKVKKEGYTGSTDDCKLVLKLKRRVKIVEGAYENIKITTPFDTWLAKLILKRRG
jgi:2-C-methyl-D-erythritol 4-phosphate cytidylyltransferase